MNTLPSITNCCAPACESTTTAIPGATGATGAAGQDGSDGISAFTTTTSAFVMPASGSTVTVPALDTSWLTTSEPVFVQNAGTMQVVGIPSATSVTLLNLGYSENAAPGASIASGSKVTPSGWKGDAGTPGTAINSPLTTKADLWTRTSSADARLQVGADGKRVVADSAQALGLRYDYVQLGLSQEDGDPKPEVQGALKIKNGGHESDNQTDGFDNLSPCTTQGDLIVRGAIHNERLGKGAQYTVLQAGATDPAYALVGVLNLDATAGRAPVDFLRYVHEAASGTAAGTFTQGSWQTRPFSSESIDTGNHGSLAANQITLAAGTYRVRASAVAFQVNRHQLRLQDITAGTPICYGLTVESPAATDAQVPSSLATRFTLAAPHVIELQHYCETTKATDGLGRAATFGTVEQYCWLELEREAK